MACLFYQFNYEIEIYELKLVFVELLKLSITNWQSTNDSLIKL